VQKCLVICEESAYFKSCHVVEEYETDIPIQVLNIELVDGC
jgi:hypothetical protein